LKYNLGTNTLAAATHGRGLFTTIVPNVVTGIGGPPPTTPYFIKYINSENGRLLIVPGNLQVRTMTLQIFDMAGRKVHESSSAYRTAVINTGRLPAGIYTLKCTGDKKENFIQKFLR
jgi:hypothetical protein